MLKENTNDLRGPFFNRTLEVKYEFDSLLECFDEIILEMNRDIEEPSIRRFKKLLRSQTEGLIQHLKILSTVFKISGMFSTRISLDEVLSLIVDTIKVELNFSRVIILLLNDDNTLLECKIITGMTPQQKLRALRLPIVMNKHDCLETKVARTGESFLINDIKDERLTDIDRKIIKNWNRQRTIYAPIISKNGIIGVLGVDAPLFLPPLRSSDVGRVQLFANHIGLLIENAKLYESIIRHKDLFERIVEHSPNGIIVINREEVKHINPAGIKILGISKSDYIGKLIGSLLGEQVADKLRYNVNESTQMEPFEFNVKVQDRRRIIINLSVVKMKSLGSLEHIIIFQDVTKKKTINKYLERLDKLATIGTIAAGIAHEVRSPLTSITMDLDSLYGDTKNEVKVRKTIAQTLNEIERIDRIISNLLQFSRLSNEGFIHADLITIIKDSLLLAKRNAMNKDIKFKTILPESMISYINPDKLRQVLINLLINSIESISSKGEIIVEANFVDKKDDILDMVLNISTPDRFENLIRIAVKDNGKGIPAEIVDRVFDPYFTTKTTGAGLGLSISSKFVNEHGGIMTVQSEFNTETLFEFFIPNKRAS